MAMLSNVKTIDMVNGEVTKIEYLGDKYTKVDDRTANVGDIMLSLIETMDITKGAYYEVVDTGYREVHKYTFFDDAEDEAHFFGGQAVVFRKEETDTSGFTEIDVEDAMVGDFVKFTGVVPDYITKGKLYKIEEIDGLGDPQVRDDDGDMFDTDMEDFVVLRKDVKGILTYNGKQYENIGAEEAKPGDLVVFHNSHSFNTTGGKPYEVKEDDQFVADNWTTLYTEGWGGKEKRDVYRLIETKQAGLSFDDFKAGDKVKLLSGGGDYPLIGFGDGNTYEVKDTNYSHGSGIRKIAIEKQSGMGRRGYADPSQLEKVTEEPIKVGDYAMVTVEYLEHKVGDILKITDTEDTGSFDFRVDRIGYDTYGFIRTENIKKISEEEGKKSEAEAEKAKLAKFKVGDIARVVKSPGASPVGTIVEITRISDFNICAKGWSTSVNQIMTYVYGPDDLEYVASK